MNENENLMTEQVADEMAENAEHTAEESTAEAPKLYSEADFTAKVNARVDEIIGEVKPKIKARTEAKVRREYEGKYGPLTEVLRAGTGKESVEEITGSLKDFYGKRGVPISERVRYSDGDVQILAKADADEFISAGYDEVVEEVERLTVLGAANMTPREKAAFKILVEHRRAAERAKELSDIGVSKDVYESDEFRSFASKYNASVPMSEVYDHYQKVHPTKEFKTAGSMKNTGTDKGTVKDFYSRDEALKFTKTDLDKNPALVKALERSMLKW